MKQRKVLFILFALLLLLGLGVVVIYVDQKIAQQQVSNGTPVTVEGEIACLPHRGDGPHTEECAFGLKANNGKYYGLADTNSYEVGQKVRVKGLLIEPLTDTYDIAGTIEKAQLSRQ